MKFVELTNCDYNTKAGNHRVEIYGDILHLIYYRTEIVTVNRANKTYSTIDYKISSSTTKAITQYKNYLNRRGYREVEVIAC